MIKCFCINHQKIIDEKTYSKCSDCGDQLSCKTFRIVGPFKDDFISENNKDIIDGMNKLISEYRIKKFKRILK